MARPGGGGAARVVLIGAALLYVGGLLVAPLYAMYAHAFARGLGAVVDALAAPRALAALGLTVKLALWAVAINTVMGVAVAYVLARHRFAGRRLVNALVDLPLAVSPIVAGLMLLLLFGPGGWLAGLRELVGTPILFNTPSMILATVFVSVPFVIREVGPLLESHGVDQEEAAATLGASPARIFFTVTLPRVRWALGYGVTLTAARALGEFGAVLVVSNAIIGKTETATIYIEMAAQDRDPIGPFAMAVALASLSVLLFAGMELLKWRRARTERAA